MTKYSCTNCEMEVINVTCGKCGIELEHKHLDKEDGSSVGVSECPNGCGRIKSPMCCGHDMASTN